MTEQRCSYAYHRVLIDSARVLDSQFADAVIQVTGAQLEMLRNMTQYLTRLTTYVSEYKPGYYLTPTVEDYDTILAVVAELEEVLMGNENLLWGYHERWSALYDHTKVGAGNYSLDGTAVAEGYVHVLEGTAHRDIGSAVTQLAKLDGGAVIIPIGVQEQSPSSYYAIEPGLRYTMEEGDKVTCTFYQAQDGDVLQLYAWGYKMKLP